MVAYFHLTRFDNQDVSSPVLQGASFSIVFHYLADISTYTPRGQIRTDYASNGGELLASFSFDPLVYQQVTLQDGSQAMATVIVAKLSASITTSLPLLTLRKLPTDKLAIGTNVCLYDLELENNGHVIRLVEGYVEVLPEVTA